MRQTCDKSQVDVFKRAQLEGHCLRIAFFFCALVPVNNNFGHSIWEYSITPYLTHYRDSLWDTPNIVSKKTFGEHKMLLDSSSKFLLKRRGNKKENTINKE